MNTTHLLAVAIVLASASAPSFAVYKCNVGGKTVYSDTQCQAGTGDARINGNVSTYQLTRKDHYDMDRAVDRIHAEESERNYQRRMDEIDRKYKSAAEETRKNACQYFNNELDRVRENKRVTGYSSEYENRLKLHLSQNNCRYFK